MGSYEKTPSTKREEENEKLNQLKNTLTKQPWFNGEPLYLYQNFWAQRLDNIIACQNHFQAQHNDIIITSIRKAGTTWLKALIFSIINRTNYPPKNKYNPLLTHNPHELVPQFETNTYAKSKCPNYINTLKPPRLFGTHIPFPSLPTSIKTSNCKIIYICRNPFDTLVSSWLFYLNLDDNKSLKPNMLGQYFDMFCEGKIPFGPFEDHVLGYWKQSIENPHKVLFIKYEDLKGNAKNQVKRMADFVGHGFSELEENEGVIDGIVKMCSLEKLKDAAVSGKSNRVYSWSRNELFFRKGVTGDWVNYLTPLMVDKLGKIMEDKFCGSGLTIW